MNAIDNSVLLQISILLSITMVLTAGFLKIRWPTLFCRVNAFGSLIPVIYGVIPGFALSCLMMIAHPATLRACLLTACFCVVGFLDDIYGTSEYRGIRGHLTALLKGVITTGLIKLVASPLLSAVFAISVFRLSNWVTYLYIVMIAASSNLFNLLDLRPGRSQGFAIIILLGILVVTPSPLAIGIVLILAITIIPDARARVMMGDSGAIAIGCGVALVVIASSNITLCISYTGLSILVNLLAEKYSIGKLIASNPFLNKLDGLFGRRV